MEYNPQQRVADFFARYHVEPATTVLSAFNTVDPLNCYYSEDVNPDEYLGYAERVLEGIGAILRTNAVLPTFPIYVELVRRSFYPEQVVDGSGKAGEGSVSSAQITAIATVIADWPLNVLPSTS